MAKTKAIEYIVDEKGRRTRVIMSYKEYLELMEDLEDLQIKARRRDEAPEDFDKVLAEFKDAGLL
jgi:hypothetical protein